MHLKRKNKVMSKTDTMVWYVLSLVAEVATKPADRGPYRLSIQDKGQSQVYTLNPGTGLGQYQYGTELSLPDPVLPEGV